MKKLFILFLPIFCFASEPKFHFEDCVKVTKGFYQGCKGRITGLSDPDKYYVTGECKIYRFSDTIKESDLTAANGCEKI